MFLVRGFSTVPPSPGNARGLICFPALAFHEVTAKEDMLGSCDGRTRQDCLTSNVQSEKRETSFFKKDICRLVLNFVGGGGRLNNNNLFYLRAKKLMMLQLDQQCLLCPV